MRSKETTPVEVGVSRFNGTDEEITICVTIPRTDTEPKRCIYVSLTPADFALALTGRGAIKGQMCTFTYDKPAHKRA